MKLNRLCAQIDYFYKVASESYLSSLAGDWIQTSQRLSQDPEFAKKYWEGQNRRNKKYISNLKESPEGQDRLKQLRQNESSQKRELISSGSLEGLMVLLRQQLADLKKDCKKSITNYSNQLENDPENAGVKTKLENSLNKLNNFESDLVIINSLRDDVNDYLGNNISFRVESDQLSKLESILRKKDDVLSQLKSNSELSFCKTVRNIYDKLSVEYENLRGLS